jgi:hypothetical protein
MIRAVYLAWMHSDERLAADLGWRSWVPVASPATQTLSLYNDQLFIGEHAGVDEGAPSHEPAVLGRYLGLSHGRSLQPCIALSTPENTTVVMDATNKGASGGVSIKPKLCLTKPVSSGSTVSLATTFNQSVSLLHRRLGCARCSVAVHL